MLKSIGSAIGLGLAWFLAGAFIGLIVFEGLVDPDGKIADIWPAVLGLPAFFGGVTFFALTRMLERGRKLHEVSLSRAAVLGALSGPAMVLFWVLLVLEIGFGEGEDSVIPWLGLAKTTAVTTPAFAIAGWFSVWMAKHVAAPPGTRAQVGGRNGEVGNPY